MTQNISVMRYWGLFALIYTMLLFAVIIAAEVLELKSNSGTNIGILLAAGFATSCLFVKKQGRAPVKAEARRLALGSCAAAVGVSLLATGFIFLIASAEEKKVIAALLQEISGGLLAIIMVIAFGITYAALIIAYGWGARKFEQILLKNDDVF
jgi:hypothetical protein